MAFYDYGDDLTSVIFSKGVTGIGSEAFCACNIQTVVIPENVIIMGDYVFDMFIMNIYVVVEHEPDGWSRFWNSVSEDKIVWGYKKNM